MAFLSGAFPDVRGIDEDEWQLLKSVVYFDRKSGTHIEVKKGTITDLASIPKIFRFIVQKSDHRTWAPSYIHDWMYLKRGKVSGKQFSRKECDRIFYEALKCNGVSSWKSWVMYLAVRIGGSW